MTVGKLKLRMLKQFPGTDPDVLEGFISDRYGEIIQELAWSRLNVSAILQTVAPYTQGTVAVVTGSNVIMLTGGAWTPQMSDRFFRVGGRAEFYGFHYVSPTAGLLDRPYEGPSELAAGYKVYQSVYALPLDVRILPEDGVSGPFGPLTKTDWAELNVFSPTRAAFGEPKWWAMRMDDSSTPPAMQIELYPIPDQAQAIPYEYVGEVETPDSSSAAFQAWMEPASAMVEGVTAKILRLQKDYAGAQLAMAEAARALKTMRANEAQRMGTATMKMGSYYTRHRARRGTEW